jgi:hypothetical protein
LESPVGRITEPIHEISALPLKPIAGTTKLKAVVEKVTFEPGTDVPLDAIADLLSSKTYQELPGPVALKDDIPVPFTLLLVFRKVNENKYLVIKYYIFSQKVGTRLVQRIASGDLFVIDYGKNFRSGSVAFQYLLERVGKLCHSHLSVRTKTQNQARKGLPWKRDLLTSRVMVQRAI